MTFSEAPVFPLLLGAAATALAVVEGDTSTPAGAAGAAGMVLVAAGLLLTGWRAVRSSTAPVQALNEGLSAGGHRYSTGPEHAPFGLRDVLAGIFLPFRRRLHGVRHIRNLQYGPAGKDNTLDLYLPWGGPQAGPVFVHFHGGRFVSGAKDREALYLLYLLASRGWSCISANYRLAPGAQFPDYAVDAKRVIAWVRTQGAQHGVGTGPPVVAGSSAGGFLAAFAALTANRPELQPGFEETDTSVAAAVCLYGYYGRVAGEDPGSTPAAYARPDAPPFFILHGCKDNVVPIGHARGFADMLRGVSRRPVVWCPLPGAQHSFDYFASVRSRAAAAAISDFACWALAQNEPPV
ncbi:alpha/beta hydrolase [Arthrobacter sp. zg-Y20]|uniref:alpha/beta hydrolase n=1 Tax=unclassified Arthrobacter TaxID=235627 RepID=UPI001D1562E2|nr:MULTISPECIES: alpha/beta hydrolase [unclassified Arthrobacter]MCC3275029.1 alpha/beta hydrolase [Arthrobacter sp. zg-Y20]MDK1315186.1 alpha/beta hydrolase [Arthrobacter sp. zg.Y20]WIB05024.1 alpha/beta hydrolase [Arthrobacter sp. zg-Y20]